MSRAAPTNCQHEPPYPGLPTVILALRSPDLVAHAASRRCPIEAPHPWDDCGEVAP